MFAAASRIGEPRLTARLLVLALFGVAAAGCAPTLTSLPTGPGAPAPSDYSTIYAQATDPCRGVRTMRTSLSLSGRSGETRLRGRIDAGLAKPDLVRLEGSPPVPFGRPVFILAGRASDATLVLTREKRVIANAPADAIIEALTGVALRPDELLAVLTGCGLIAAAPEKGRAYDANWMAVDLGDTTDWLRQVNGQWRIVATVRGPLEIRYEEFTPTHPSRIRIRTTDGSSRPPADITLRVSDVDMNEPLGPEVFRVDVPTDAVPITIEELRRAREGPASREGGGRQ